MHDSEQVVQLNERPRINEKTDLNTQDVVGAGVTKGSFLATIIAGITASACCIGPFVLLTLGVSGSWISNFSALEPLRPVFIGITAIFLGLTYRKLYILPKTCDINFRCANPSYLRKQRFIFWFVTAAVIAIIAFPWYGPLLLDD